LETETMTASTIDTAIPSTPRVGLADARFISLVTYRRTGEPVATPVLFVFDGDRLLVRTAHDAGKLKRLAHTSHVEVAPCDQRGRTLGPAIRGEGRILAGDAVAPALARLHARYRIAGPLFTTLRHLRGKRDVIIEIVLDVAC
jgi:PPOX class probable F420-dependent enzyme